MAKPVHNTLSAFESFDDRPALFDGDAEFTYRELLALKFTAQVLGLRFGALELVTASFEVESFVETCRGMGSATPST